MKMRTWMLVGTLLAMPALSQAQEQPAAKPAATANAPSVKPKFDLKNSGIQDVIRAAAASSVDTPTQDEAALSGTEMEDLPFRAPRRLHHMDCDSLDCVAYTSDGVALYSIPREQYYGVHGNNPREQWLSCQSGNDLLSTFERYDNCRGVSIGIPSQFQNVVLKLPNIRL